MLSDHTDRTRQVPSASCPFSMPARNDTDTNLKCGFTANKTRCHIALDGWKRRHAVLALEQDFRSRAVWAHLGWNSIDPGRKSSVGYIRRHRLRFARKRSTSISRFDVEKL